MYDIWPKSVAIMPNPSDVRAAVSAAPGASPRTKSRAGRAQSCVAAMAPHLDVPTAERPLRVKMRKLRADTRVMPHSHAWAQIAISATGVIRLSTERGTYIVPPWRALWIPPGVEHAVTVVEDADMRTLYVHQPAGRCGPDVEPADEAPWRACRVLEVSELLRALVREMPCVPDDAPPLPPAALQRERLLSALILDEMRRASAVPLGVDLPRDKRLRQLCEAVLADPTRHEALADWARDTGASPRTVARLFRQDLGRTFTQWRQQVILARAVALAAGRMPIKQIAAELGYNSPSAFSAMVHRAVGMPPARFLGLQHD